VQDNQYDVNIQQQETDSKILPYMSVAYAALDPYGTNLAVDAISNYQLFQVDTPKLVTLINTPSKSDPAMHIMSLSYASLEPYGTNLVMKKLRCL